MVRKDKCREHVATMRKRSPLLSQRPLTIDVEIVVLKIQIDAVSTSIGREVVGARGTGDAWPRFALVVLFVMKDFLPSANDLDASREVFLIIFWVTKFSVVH